MNQTLESLRASQNPGLTSARARDAADPLLQMRTNFDLPDELIYLDGNSLGAMPVNVPQRLQQAALDGWRTGLIRSWNARNWHELPLTLGDRLAKLMGAAPGEVLIVDSTSINLFKLLSAALELRPNRRTIVSEQQNFPSDLHIIQGTIDHFYSDHRLLLGGDDDDSVVELITEDTAVVTLTHISYRTGLIRDMQRITEAAHASGALVIFDLAHSLGAVPVDLNNTGVDFAVGCTYKYLNAGPGGPAYLFIADRHLQGAQNPLTGWQGHADPFSFDTRYVAAGTIEKFRCGTPAILSYIALEESLDIFEGIDLSTVRQKSIDLTDFFIELVESMCQGHGLTLASPRDSSRRGSQVCLTSAHGWPIMQALIAHGVIGDFRAPDILRFGFAPLYIGYEDVWVAVALLAEILDSGTWENPVYATRKLVT